MPTQRRAPRCGPALAALLTLLLTGPARAQDSDDGRGHPPIEAGDVLAGTWSGAYVLAESVQLLTLHVDRGADGWLADPVVPEWPFLDFDPRPLSVGEDGRVVVELPYGSASLGLDVERRELAGHVLRGDGSELRLHLKRVPREPPLRMTLSELEVTGSAGRIRATLALPPGEGPFPAIVWVHGRGCWTGGRSGFLERAQGLARHGVASVAYDKRGTGDSAGSCDTATHDDLVEDVLAVLDVARSVEALDAARVGLAGTSAGGWTVVAAGARAARPPAFLITIVGPGTSVEQQQRDNALLIARDLGLSEEELARVRRYQDLMFDRDVDPVSAHAEMTALLEHARETGWIAYHEDTDIPTSPEDVGRLWVRRFAYDPAADLRAWDGPFLAVLGGADRVVPSMTNAAALRRHLATGGNTRFHVEILPLAGHGLWIQETTVADGELNYHGFSRIAPGAQDALVDFLLEEGLIAAP